MVPRDPDDPNVLPAGNHPDYELFRYGPVVHFPTVDIVRSWLGQLNDAGYRVVPFASGDWRTVADVFKAFEAPGVLPLSKPVMDEVEEEIEIRSLDDLRAKLSVQINPETCGLALVFNRFDEFALWNRAAAQGVLAAVDRTAYYHLLRGRKLVALVHTAKEGFELPPLPARPLSREVRGGVWVEGGALPGT